MTPRSSLHPGFAKSSDRLKLVLSYFAIYAELMLIAALSVGYGA